MSLVDTSDSVIMTGVYGWAFVHPLRKLWYNLTLTSLSVLVALLIGSLEGLGLIADKLNLHGGAFGVIQALNGDLTNFGFMIIGVFVMGWLLSVCIYRLQGFENT
jgi:high-affinity nickel-transport protein